MIRVLNLLLTHQGAPAVARMLDVVARLLPGLTTCSSSFDGAEDDVRSQIAHPHKVRVDDPRLRTVRHSARTAELWRGLDPRDVPLAGRAREPVHRTCIFRGVRSSAARRGVSMHVANRPGWRRNAPTCSASSSRAWTARTSRTCSTTLLHARLFRGTLARRSACGAIKGVMLSMFGSGTFWTREAFDAVAVHAGAVPDLPGALSGDDWRTISVIVCATGGSRTGTSAAWATSWIASNEARRDGRVDAAPGQDDVDEGGRRTVEGESRSLRLKPPPPTRSVRRTPDRRSSGTSFPNPRATAWTVPNPSSDGSTCCRCCGR